MKKLLINLSISLLAIIITLVIAEFVFRTLLFSNFSAFDSLREPSYYAEAIHYEGEDFYDEDYWKLHYYFKKTFDQPSAHPLLGWIGFFNGSTYIHKDEGQLQNRRPVLLFGDSFAKCVDSVACFEDILNKDTSFNKNHFLLNYGVGGYGVDQIHLLTKEVSKRFEKPFVILSLLTNDMDRSMLKVRDAQKPFFSLENGELQLHQEQLTIGSAEYFDNNPPDINSFLWSKFKNSDIYPFEKVLKNGEQYIAQSKALNAAILQQSFDYLHENQIEFVVLIFHPNTSSLDNWRLTFLRNLLNKNNIPFICDYELRQSLDPFHLKNHKKYIIEGDGHPTSYSNQFVANELKHFILNKNYRKEVIWNNSLWEDSLYLPIKLMEEQIIKNADWLKKVQQQANERAIGLNEMIYRNARYMLEQENNITIKDVHFYQQRIRQDANWLKNLETQAMERDISLDSIILLSARYMVKMDRKKANPQ